MTEAITTRAGPQLSGLIRAVRRAACHGGGWPAIRAVLLACAASLAAAAGAAPLTLAVADLPAFAPALLAEAQGYYAAEGLDLKIVHCVNGRRCLQHLTDGEAHFATVADTPIVMASHAGARFDIVATFASAYENRLIARADRGVRTAADLKGKRIGFVKGTTGQFFTDTFLILNNIDPDEVTLVPLEAVDAVERLARGDVDAAGLYQPHGYLAGQRLGKNAVVLPGARLNMVTFNLVTQPAGAAVRTQDVEKVLRALRRACDFIDTQPAQARALLALRLQLEPALLDAIWAGYEFRVALEQSLIANLEAESRWALREGLVPRGTTPDYLDRIKPTALRSIDPRAVSIVK